MPGELAILQVQEDHKKLVVLFKDLTQLLPVIMMLNLEVCKKKVKLKQKHMKQIDKMPLMLKRKPMHGELEILITEI